MLSDPQKRQIYDVYGVEGLKGGSGPADEAYAEAASRRAGSTAGFAGTAPGGGMRYEFRGDPSEMFAQFFGAGFARQRSAGEGGLGGMGDLFGGAGGARREGQRLQRPVVQVALGCSLEDLYRGCTKKLKITRKSTTLQRPAEKVVRDVRDGVVSVAAALRDYAVVVDENGRLDVEATATARCERGV